MKGALQSWLFFVVGAASGCLGTEEATWTMAERQASSGGTACGGSQPYGGAFGCNGVTGSDLSGRDLGAWVSCSSTGAGAKVSVTRFRAYILRSDGTEVLAQDAAPDWGGKYSWAIWHAGGDDHTKIDPKVPFALPNDPDVVWHVGPLHLKIPSGAMGMRVEADVHLSGPATCMVGGDIGAIPYDVRYPFAELRSHWVGPSCWDAITISTPRLSGDCTELPAPAAPPPPAASTVRLRWSGAPSSPALYFLGSRAYSTTSCVGWDLLGGIGSGTTLDVPFEVSDPSIVGLLIQGYADVDTNPNNGATNWATNIGTLNALVNGTAVTPVKGAYCGSMYTNIWIPLPTTP